MASGYAELLRTPHAARLLTGTLVGRLPNATGHVAIVLLVRAEGGGYALAGALAAAYGLANAAGQPLLGRAADLYGQPRVMLPAAVLSALAMVGFAVTGPEPLPLACATVVAAGFCTPPLEGGLRALWPDVLAAGARGTPPGGGGTGAGGGRAAGDGAAARRGDRKRDRPAPSGRPDPAGRVQTAYALDAVAQEVMFTAGPLVLVLGVALWSEAGALVAVNAVGVLGALSVVLSAPSRAWRSAPRESHWLGALRSRGLLSLLGAFFFVGTALGSITVAAVAYADGYGGGGGGNTVYGLIMSALGLGALIGGVAYGARSWTGAPERRLRVLAALLAVGYLPLILTPGPVAMTALAVLAGVFLAPALACAFVVVDRHAPRGTVTEAFSWLVTTFGVGAAAGTAAAGPAVEYAGSPAGFAVAGASGCAALLVLLATRRILDAPYAVPRAAVPSARGQEGGPRADQGPDREKDRDGDPEHGFRRGGTA
ncbi:MFS transporter [Streptomyces zingiberis]|uniref:MFS transporter n=1 Tax=Streptomyces zingiberis TaxID=2053010 RepID=UPI0028933A22|nr:MFS transporter [Streptomyces zingiberis]